MNLIPKNVQKTGMDLYVYKLQNYIGIILKFSFVNVMKREIYETVSVLRPTADSDKGYRDLL